MLRIESEVKRIGSFWWGHGTLSSTDMTMEYDFEGRSVTNSVFIQLIRDLLQPYSFWPPEVGE